MIVDTSFIIDLLHNDTAAVRKSKELLAGGEIFSITSVSIFELWQGQEDFANKQKRDKIFELLARLGHFDLDFESAKIGGKIYRELKNKGQLIDSHDVMIASIAINKGETVLTRNIKDFSKIAELRVESY